MTEIVENYRIAIAEYTIFIRNRFISNKPLERNLLSKF